MNITKTNKFLYLVAFVSMAFSGASYASDDLYNEDEDDGNVSAQELSLASLKGGKIVIANRASGTLSIISARSDVVVATVNMPAGVNTPQPMYVVHAAKSDNVFVGDRGNNRVVVFDDKTFKVKAIIPAGKGVFHMWADPAETQLWVANDIDNTATVIDPETLDVITTIAMPTDIINLGGKPHDVILDTSGDAAFVTFLVNNNVNDFVVKFDTSTYKELARAEVGKDPHVSLTRKNKLLYVPTQDNNAVFILKRSDLSLVKVLNIPGAHGIAISKSGKTVYTTNISGGGVDGLFSISTKSNEVIGQAEHTQFPVPHNIVLNKNSKKLYITHSGATSDQVTVYTLNEKTRLPTFSKAVSVGNNPFGLTFVK